MKIKMKPLEYNYGDFEPYISAKTMSEHYEGLYRDYVVKLNQVINSIDYSVSVDQLLMSIQDYPIKRNDIIRYAGGVSNHELFFDSLTRKRTKPNKNLSEAIVKSFGSYDQMIENITTVSESLFGSGYVFLVIEDDDLAIIKTVNQNSPLIYNFYPLIAIDLWEHSYFLDYLSKRNQYIESIMKLLNWDNANDLYAKYTRNIRNGIYSL